MEKRPLTIIEVSEYTGYKKSYIYKLIWAGKIPHSKPTGGRLFFDKDKLDAWLLSNSSSRPDEKERVVSTYVTTHA